MSDTYAVDPWAKEPLKKFIGEANARLALLMTPAGQVIAQHGFNRAVDVMAAAALGAAIVSSTTAVAKLLEEPMFSALNHQGEQHGIFLAGFDSPRGRMIVLGVYGTESSPGLVQLFYEDFVRDIVAACPDAEPPRKVLAEDFEKELNESLSALFGT
ncbi:MAG: roadblock/LC7 domain-containing protein [Gemmatimonadota bacterium]|nr:roadblock/LC7 domain-containing protein [Gemmatimonadota bacterium]